MPNDGDAPRGRRFLGTDRLAAFSDGIFSIAATLLVLVSRFIRRAHRWTRCFRPGLPTWRTSSAS
jgi:hypothetical protein